jgi:hypothetical protein
VKQEASKKIKRRNCQYCYKKLKELKIVTQHEKWMIPLHTGCFKERIIISLVMGLSHKIERHKLKID